MDLVGLIILPIFSLVIFAMFKQAAQIQGRNRWNWAFAGVATFLVSTIVLSFILSLIFDNSSFLNPGHFVLGGVVTGILYRKLIHSKNLL
ncbi:MAG TPA: hypothetical protein PLZ43_11800 [bacterium]|nr:hypothetical protein [bacterium]